MFFVDWKKRFPQLQLLRNGSGNVSGRPVAPLISYHYLSYEEQLKAQQVPVSLPAVGGFIENADRIIREFDARAGS